MLTATPARASSRTTGMTRALLLGGGDPRRPGPGGFAADVDEVRALLGAARRPWAIAASGFANGRRR